MPKQKLNQTKIEKILKQKYPYFKKDDVRLLVNIIDDSEEKDNVYETLGLFKPKKTKTTKKQLAELATISARDEEYKEEIVIESKSSLDNFMCGLTIER